MRSERSPFGQCKSCGRDIVWIRTRKGKWLPVLPARQDGTAVHPRDTFAQGTHTAHFADCPDAAKHRRDRPAPKKSAPPPLPSRMGSEALAAAAAFYRGIPQPGPAQRARLAELEEELRAREELTRRFDPSPAGGGGEHTLDDEMERRGAAEPVT